MSLEPEITTGDDTTIQIQLTKDEANFSIDSTAVVKASLVSKDKKVVLIDPVTVQRVVLDPETSDPLSDWVNSLIFIQFSEAETGAITSKNYGTVWLEIQVDDDVNSFGKKTWFLKSKVIQGTIDQ